MSGTPQLTGAPSRTVPWPQFTGPPRPGRAQCLVPSRWPVHVPGATLDYAVDLSGWLAGVNGVADVIGAGGLAAGVARIDGASLGSGDLSLLWVRTSGGLVVACLQNGLPGISYAVLIAVGTTAGRLQPLYVLIDCAGMAGPALLDTPSPGAPWPIDDTEVPATTTTLGGVIVPTGSGLSVDGSGNLRLSAAGLPTSPAGLPVGALWNNAGVLAIVTVY